MGGTNPASGGTPPRRGKQSLAPLVRIREIVFGLEDGLVSTLGAVTGIAAGSGSTYVVVLSGLVLIVVEALSMGAGSYLSEKSNREAMYSRYADDPHMKKHLPELFPETDIKAGFIMWASYMIGGIIPLAPYFFLSINNSYAPSIIGATLALFGLGVWKSRHTKRDWVKSAFEMVVVSLGAVIIGFMIGRLVSGFFGINVY